MYGLMYSVNFSITGATAAQDLFDIICVTPDILVIHSIRIGQDSLEGDAAAEMLEISLARAAAVGSGGTNPTPAPHMFGAPAATAVVNANVTTPAASPTILLSDSFNLQAGWLYLPTPEERIIVSSAAAADVFVCTLSLPSTSVDLQGTMTFEEILG